MVKVSLRYILRPAASWANSQIETGLSEEAPGKVLKCGFTFNSKKQKPIKKKIDN